MTTKRALTARHVELLGKRPPRDFTPEQIAAKIATVEKAQSAQNEERDRRAKETAERKSILDHNSSTRGTAEEFSSRAFTQDANDDDRHLAWMLRRALEKVTEFETQRVKFAKQIESDPVHALSWADSFYRCTGEYTVAREIISHFEAGYSLKMLQQYLTSEAIRQATNLPNSSSQASNMMTNYLRTAFAHAAQE